MSCSKLSNAISLFSRSTSSECSASIAAFIRSASEGPPKRAESISGVRPRAEESAVLLEALGASDCWVVEFWILHLRRLFMFASMLGRFFFG